MRRHRRRNRHERMILRRKVFFVALLVAAIILGLFVFYKWLRNKHFHTTDIVLPSETASLTEQQTPFDVNHARKEHIYQVLRQAEKMVSNYDYNGAIRLLESDVYYRETLEMLEYVETLQNEKTKLVPWAKTEEVTVLAFDSIVVDPQRAYYGNAHAADYNKNTVTEKEFRKILQYLYDNNYVLVKMTDLMSFSETKDQDGNVTATQKKRETLYLPEGKKPIVITQNHVNYFSSMTGNGFASRLVLDLKGNVLAEYREKDGSIKIGAYDLVPIVEEFVENHPGFSYHGAKGVLGLTASEGILGYRIQYTDDENYEDYLEAVTLVVDRLKENGWEFACESYSNQHVKNISFDEFSRDCKQWVDVVRPVLGTVPIYFWPFGEDSDGGNEIGTWRSYSGVKYDLLKDMGFRYFCNIDATNPSWVQMTDRYLRMGRIDITGARLLDEIKNNRNRLSFLFPASEVLDRDNRPEMR